MTNRNNLSIRAIGLGDGGSQQGNPMDRWVSIKVLLGAAMRNVGQQNWINWAPAIITLSVNATMTSSTGMSPYAMMYGRGANIHLDVLVGPPQEGLMCMDINLLTHAMFLSENI